MWHDCILSLLYKAKCTNCLLENVRASGRGPRADNDNASARCRFDRIFFTLILEISNFLFTQAQMTLLGPQKNNMPSKGHVILLMTLVSLLNTNEIAL